MIEEYYKQYTDNIGRKVFITSGLLFLSIFSIIFNYKHLFVYSLLYALLGASVLFYPFRNYWGLSLRKAGSSFRNVRINERDDLMRIVEFSEKITYITTSLHKVSYYDYSQVTQIIESKSLYNLILKKEKTCIMVKKECFTVGEEQEFLTFLKNRCENLK